MINIQIDNNIFDNENIDIINNINLNIKKLENLKNYLNTNLFYKNIYNHTDHIILKSFCYMIDNDESFWIILTRNFDFYNISKKINGRIEYSNNEDYIYDEKLDNHFTKMITNYEDIYEFSKLSIKYKKYNYIHFFLSYRYISRI